MSITFSKRKNKTNLISILKVHRWMGLISLFFIMILSVTGIMLNHTEALKLGHHPINNQWLQQWYGIKMPSQQGYVKLDQDWIAQIGQHIYFNQIKIANESSKIISAYKNRQLIVVAFQQSILLLSHQGELIEKLNQDTGLPIPISQLSIKKNTNEPLILVGQQLYSSEDNFLSWQKNPKTPFIKLILSHPSDSEKEPFRMLYLGSDLSLERVILDMHSGRLLGNMGVFLMDIVALLMIFLSLSGLWIFSKRKKRRQTLD